MGRVEVIDDIDKRLVAALQIDPRASWRRIATVLGQPERSIARKGTELLNSGVVRVAGLRVLDSWAVVRMRCAPGTSEVAADSIAQRRECTFSYVTTGGAACVAEICVDHDRMGLVLGRELPATVGVVEIVSYPVLRYFRTVRGWRAPGLTASEVKQLSSPLTEDRTPKNPGQLADIHRHHPHDEDIIEALVADGRAPMEALARRVGVSETTVARRLDALLTGGLLQIRALVEPAAVGLGMEAMLWFVAPPDQIEPVGRFLADCPEVRYAAAVAGPHQLVAEVTLPDSAALYDFIRQPRLAPIQALEMNVVLRASKRGGYQLPRAW